MQLLNKRYVVIYGLVPQRPGAVAANVNFDINDITMEGNDNSDDNLSRDFSYSEIEKIINKLKNDKSCGINNNVNEFIKYSPSDYKRLLVKLFNSIPKNGNNTLILGYKLYKPNIQNQRI